MKTSFKITNEGVWIIVDGECVGRVGIYGAVGDKELENQGSKAIAYSIFDDRFKRLGLMKTAVKLFIEHTDWCDVHAVILPDNIASQRTVLACGFTRVDHDYDSFFMKWHIYRFEKSMQISEAV